MILWTPWRSEGGLALIGVIEPLTEGFSDTTSPSPSGPLMTSCTLVFDNSRQSPSAPTAPTTAETTTAGAGAEAPGSFQKPDVQECDGEWPYR